MRSCRVLAESRRSVSASDYVSTFRGEGVEPDLVALPVGLRFWSHLPELFEPLAKLAALCLSAVFADLFGCSEGGFAGALVCCSLDLIEFGRREGCVLDPSVRYAEFGWRCLACFQILDGDAELARDWS